jgi:hypothetical protein
MIKNKLFTLTATVALCCATFAAKPVSAQVADDNSPGSFLVFPKFDIRDATSTQLRIVNNGDNLRNSTGDVVDLKVKLNYVCPGVKHVNEFCAALDRTYTFTVNQTRIIDVAGDHPPCQQGYVIAYVLDPITSRPVAYNHLTGSYHINEGAANSADNAIAIQSPFSDGSTLGSINPTQLRIGGDYSAVGTTLYTDFLSSCESPANGSRLTLLTLDVLAGMQNPPAVVAIDFWNAAEVPFSTSSEFICWEDKELEDIDVNFLEDNLGTEYGSMKITPIANCPLPGGCPPLAPYDATILGAITEWGDGTTGGRTLFHDQTPKGTTYQPR